MKEQLGGGGYTSGLEAAHSTYGQSMAIPNYRGGWEMYLVGCQEEGKKRFKVNS